MSFDVPAWGVALLVLYPLVQLPVVLYLSRHVELRDGESAPHPAEGYAFHAGEEAGEPSTGSVEPADRPTGSGVACRLCGATNGGEFRFCHNCVARLG